MEKRIKKVEEDISNLVQEVYELEKKVKSLIGFCEEVIKAFNKTEKKFKEIMRG